jgi:type III secretory pathway lipoprotein EscJ
MALTPPTVAEVRQVIATSLPDATIQVLITDAATLVAACIESLEPERQTVIVKYVAADMIAAVISTQGKGPKVSSSLGDASDSWAGSVAGAEYGKSAYWQRAVMFDPNGCLRKLGLRRIEFAKV